MSSYKKFTKIITSSTSGSINPSDFNRLQDNIQDSINPIIQNTLLNSQKLTGIVLLQGQTNNVPHLLGRIPNGWTTLNQYAQADLWNAQASDANFLYLVCSSNVTVDLMVS